MHDQAELDLAARELECELATVARDVGVRGFASST